MMAPLIRTRKAQGETDVKQEKRQRGGGQWLSFMRCLDAWCGREQMWEKPWRKTIDKKWVVKEENRKVPGVEARRGSEKERTDVNWQTPQTSRWGQRKDHEIWQQESLCRKDLKYSRQILRSQLCIRKWIQKRREYWLWVVQRYVRVRYNVCRIKVLLTWLWVEEKKSKTLKIWGRDFIWRNEILEEVEEVENP